MELCADSFQVWGQFEAQSLSPHSVIQRSSEQEVSRVHQFSVEDVKLFINHHQSSSSQLLCLYIPSTLQCDKLSHKHRRCWENNTIVYFCLFSLTFFSDVLFLRAALTSFVSCYLMALLRNILSAVWSISLVSRHVLIPRCQIQMLLWCAVQGTLWPAQDAFLTTSVLWNGCSLVRFKHQVQQ